MLTIKEEQLVYFYNKKTGDCLFVKKTDGKLEIRLGEVSLIIKKNLDLDFKDDISVVSLDTICNV